MKVKAEDVVVQPHKMDARGQIRVRGGEGDDILLDVPLIMNIPKGFKGHNFMGEEFGRLKVLYMVKGKPNHTMWLCKCDCGNFKVARGNSLKRGHTKSCGCQTGKLPYGESSFNRIYINRKHAAKKRGIKFELTKEQFRVFTKRNCFYCGSVPSSIEIGGNGGTNGEYIYNGVDKVDNTKDYTLDNVVPCCFNCNRAKWNLSIQDFSEWLLRIIDNSLGLKKLLTFTEIEYEN